MREFSRDEVEEAFRHNYLTGPVGEDWKAWSELFTDDALYWDHYWGRFTGPREIEWFLDGTMSCAPAVYTPMTWYAIDGSRVVWKGVNRADNPAPGGEPFGFESLQILTYAGGGKWSREEDWWLAFESQRFAREYAAACAEHDPEHPARMTRENWGDWVDWARPPAGHEARPSWLGRSDVTPLRTVRDADFGERNPK